MGHQNSKAEAVGSTKRFQIADVELENELYRRGQVALEAAHQESLVLFEQAPVGFFLLDSNGAIRRVNRKGADALGRSAAELRESNFAHYVSEPSVELFGGHLRKTLTSKKGEASDLLLQRGDGCVFWARVRSEFTPASRIAGEGIFLTVDEIDDLMEIDRRIQTSAPPPLPKPVSIRGRVLVIDDEELILNATSRVLRRMGYEVIGFTDPDAALDGFEEDPDSYDAIITDFRMPTMNGLQLSERLKSKRENLSILLMSGFTGEIDLERAREIGVDRVASKPLSYEELAVWLSDAMECRDLE